jgi:hypothetical protein
MKILLCKIDCIPVVTRPSPGLEGIICPFVGQAPLVTGAPFKFLPDRRAHLGDSVCHIC